MDKESNLVEAGGEDRLPNDTRVAILFERFGPYHHARLNAAGRLLRIWGVEACAMEATYAWAKVEGAAAFTRVTLTERDSGDRQWRRELQEKMWPALDAIQPQVVVVPGWSGTDALSALRWCVRTNTPSVVMSESTAWDERRVAAKEWIKRRLVRLNSAGLAGGTSHVEYLTKLGMARDRVFLGYDSVDNQYFADKADEVRRRSSEVSNPSSGSKDASASRSQFPPSPFFLASARFVEKKNLFRLLEAYAKYRTLCDHHKSQATDHRSSAVSGPLVPWSLVLLGDGPLRSSILERRSSLGLDAWVHLPGFKQYDELPAYFGRAGAFVHASTTEQWGLVVNEAMASELPVLVSNRCGCAQDLVVPGENGFQFDPENVAEMAQLMVRVSDPRFPLAQFGAASARVIAAWGPERFATGLREAVAAALNRPRPQAGWFDRFLLRLLLQR